MSPRISKLKRFFTLSWLACTMITVGLVTTLHAQNDDIVGLWEGRKVDGRFKTTEPWGPFLIEKKSDGTLKATFLGGRLGQRDLPMYEVTLKNGKFKLQMNRWGGASLDATFSPEEGIVGTLRHHGMTEKLTLQKIPDRTDNDILALLKSGKIADNPPYQSEFMSLLINKGPETAMTLLKAVHEKKPGHKLWGPGVVNSYGYELLNKKKTAEAVAVFKLNALAYADDPNSFDSLGEGYIRNGDRELAIKALQKSLSLNPPQNVRQNSMKLLKELGINDENEVKGSKKSD